MPTAGLPLGNGPLTLDTWPPLQLICMRAQLFISSSSVFEVRLLLLITVIMTFFLKINLLFNGFDFKRSTKSF